MHAEALNSPHCVDVLPNTEGLCGKDRADVWNELLVRLQVVEVYADRVKDVGFGCAYAMACCSKRPTSRSSKGYDNSSRKSILSVRRLLRIFEYSRGLYCWCCAVATGAWTQSLPESKSRQQIQFCCEMSVLFLSAAVIGQT